MSKIEEGIAALHREHEIQLAKLQSLFPRQDTRCNFFFPFDYMMSAHTPSPPVQTDT